MAEEIENLYSFFELGYINRKKIFYDPKRSIFYEGKKYEKNILYIEIINNEMLERAKNLLEIKLKENI